MPLHIVCRSGASSSLIERFVVAGADVTFVSLVRVCCPYIVTNFAFVLSIVVLLYMLAEW